MKKSTTAFRGFRQTVPKLIYSETNRNKSLKVCSLQQSAEWYSLENIILIKFLCAMLVNFF